MRQDDWAEFISASLNTGGILKRAALERKKSAGAYRTSGQRHPITLR